MPNSQYRRGTRTEKKSRDWLESRGFYVLESRGSHGAVDLIAINADTVRLIQVKGGRAMYPKERAEAVAALLKIPVPPNGAREIMTWARYAREPQVEEV